MKTFHSFIFIFAGWKNCHISNREKRPTLRMVADPSKSLYFSRKSFELHGLRLGCKINIIFRVKLSWLSIYITAIYWIFFSHLPWIHISSANGNRKLILNTKWLTNNKGFANHTFHLPTNGVCNMFHVKHLQKLYFCILPHFLFF